MHNDRRQRGAVWFVETPLLQSDSIDAIRYDVGEMDDSADDTKVVTTLGVLRALLDERMP